MVVVVGVVVVVVVVLWEKVSVPGIDELLTLSVKTLHKLILVRIITIIIYYVIIITY